jgi:peroxiredoxin
LRDIVDDLASMNTQLVAITPQLCDKSREMVEKHKLNFPILRDEGNAYMEKLGLRFVVPDDVLEVYGGFGIDIPGSNGEDSNSLPIPCRLIIGTDGVVQVADIDPNYTARPEPDKTLADVKALQG